MGVEGASPPGVWITEPWFWATAALIWGRAATGVFGAPSRVIRAAQGDVSAARFAFDLVRYRLGQGRVTPLGLAPFRLPLFGGLLGYAVVNAIFGVGAPLTVAAMLAPILAADFAQEPRMLRAIEESNRKISEAGGSYAADALTSFQTALEDAMKLRRAAVLAAVVLTLVSIVSDL